MIASVVGKLLDTSIHLANNARGERKGEAMTALVWPEMTRTMEAIALAGWAPTVRLVILVIVVTVCCLAVLLAI